LALEILWGLVTQGVALGWYGLGPLALQSRRFDYRDVSLALREMRDHTIESCMPQSLSFLLVHIVFSTKDRTPLLAPEIHPALHAYLATVARNADCECFRAGGVADHVHLAIRLARTITVADLVETLKTSSSKWLKTQSPALVAFAWQRGYGAFSVGPSDRDALFHYIDGQEEHHRTRTFQEEYRKQLGSVLDFACGSGSLLLNIRKQLKASGGNIGKIYGQEKNITTYNLARMNMLLHGVKDTEFEIYHGDTLTNDWDFLRETNPAKMPKFDAVVANPPFSYRWEPKDDMSDDVRFKNYGLAPKSAADFAFLLHGFHFLKDQGVMAIILPHGVLFRGGAEEKIRRKLLEDGHIDTVIGLPPNLFYSTGIPVCILVLKKCKKPDDVLFINAAEHFEKGKRQNVLLEEHIDKIVETYQQRPKSIERYARRVGMAEIEKEGFNLNISRYISTATAEEEIILADTHAKLVEIEKSISGAKAKHNDFLKELKLPPLP